MCNFVGRNKLRKMAYYYSVVFGDKENGNISKKFHCWAVFLLIVNEFSSQFKIRNFNLSCMGNFQTHILKCSGGSKLFFLRSIRNKKCQKFSGELPKDNFSTGQKSQHGRGYSAPPIHLRVLYENLGASV